MVESSRNIQQKVKNPGFSILSCLIFWILRFFSLIDIFIQSDLEVRSNPIPSNSGTDLTWSWTGPSICFRLGSEPTTFWFLPHNLHRQTFHLWLTTKCKKSQTKGREKSEVINDFSHLASRVELWKLHLSSVWAPVVSAINVSQLAAPSLLASLDATSMRWVVIIGQKVALAMHK